jgi:hypothetical protein
MIPMTITTVLLLLSLAVILAVLRRRGRADDDRFNLGTVSEHWLLVHKGKDR